MIHFFCRWSWFQLQLSVMKMHRFNSQYIVNSWIGAGSIECNRRGSPLKNRPSIAGEIEIWYMHAGMESKKCSHPSISGFYRELADRAVWSDCYGWLTRKAVFFVMEKCHLNVWLTPDTVLLCKAYLWHLCYQEDAVSSPVAKINNACKCTYMWNLYCTL